MGILLLKKQIEQSEHLNFELGNKSKIHDYA